MSEREEDRNDDGECFAMFDPFAKAVWAPSVRVSRSQSIAVLEQENGFRWYDLWRVGWRVVHVRLDVQKRERKFRPHADLKRKRKSPSLPTAGEG